MPDLIHVVGTLLSLENHTLGGRRVVGLPSLRSVVVDGVSMTLLPDDWSKADGTFELDCVKVAGLVYTIQTRPERLLPRSLELRCDDWAAGSTVDISQLPYSVPSPPPSSTTLAELEAALQVYIDANTRSLLQFSDVRLALTVGAGDMGLPNAAGRDLTITEVGMHASVGPVGADLVIDLNVNGSSVFTDQSQRPRVLDGATAGTSGTIGMAAFAQGDVLTVDIDEVGSTNAGGHLTVIVTVQG